MGSRMTVFTVEGPAVELFISDCAICGVVFGIPQTLEKRRRGDHRDFYCPNGHSMVFRGKSDEQKLNEERARRERTEDALFESIIAAEQMRGIILRDRERFAAGLCPCCRRSFDNVRRHMADQHPDYSVQRVADLAKPVKAKCSCGRGFNTVHGLHRHQSYQRQPDWWKPETGGWAAHLTVVPARG